MKVGLIGLGIMGRPMAANLLKGGHALFAHDHKPVPEALLSQGAVACGSGEEVALQAEVVITMVPDTPHVASALFGGICVFGCWVHPGSKKCVPGLHDPWIMRGAPFRLLEHSRCNMWIAHSG